MNPIVRSILGSGTANVWLWLSTGLVTLWCFVWVTLGGSEYAEARASALVSMLPFAVAWYGAIAVKSGVTGFQKVSALNGGDILK